ncbi:hypothetical protein MTR67_016156 [Solanum verrucosum]|uniref:NB-ARC domain-containing protein n=1 Tax=Solanum verrucosum TaxID=315347 RepID=A0AAF0QGB8_SOLVR|nr:hypothetical protein MTR67_016156 [Solanum verrucosum]
MELLSHDADQILELTADSLIDASSMSDPMLSDHLKDDIVQGLDCDLKIIDKRLRGPTSDLDIVTISGMGGIGKTTLTKKAYDHLPIRCHFDIFVWVTISQEFRYRNALLEALHCISKKKVIVNAKDDVKMEDNELADLVQKNLKGPRYLVVVDDIWSRDVWDSISQIFPNCNNRSRVLLTTRETKVAMYANTSSPHTMNLLDLDNSWKLLRDKVFGLEHDHPPELEEIGKTIAEKCQGLPLIISVIAGYLSKTVAKTLESWKYVAKTLSEIIANHPNKCLGVLEGFIRTSSGSHESLEEVAKHYLEDLISRNLIMARKKDSMVRVLAIFPDWFGTFPLVITKLFHLRSLQVRCFGNIPESISELLNLQTLICDVISSDMTLPRKIWMMKNLRKLTLALCCDFIWEEISSTFIMLPNLEELKLKRCRAKDDIWRLTDKDIFKSLKLLLLSYPNLKRWEASSDSFPNLKRLILKNCEFLQEIPTDFGEIGTLESIELHDCRTISEDSARNIEQEQKEMGNNILKVYIHSSHNDDLYFLSCLCSGLKLILRDHLMLSSELRTVQFIFCFYILIIC